MLHIIEAGNSRNRDLPQGTQQEVKGGKKHLNRGREGGHPGLGTSDDPPSLRTLAGPRLEWASSSLWVGLKHHVWVLINQGHCGD